MKVRSGGTASRNRLVGLPVVGLEEMETRWTSLCECLARLMKTWQRGTSRPFHCEVVGGGMEDPLSETIAQIRGSRVTRLNIIGRDDMWRITVFLPIGTQVMAVTWQGKPSRGRKEDLAILLAFSRAIGPDGIDMALSTWPREAMLQRSLMALRSRQVEKDGDRQGVELLLDACGFLKEGTNHTVGFGNLLGGAPRARTLGWIGGVESAFKTHILRRREDQMDAPIQWGRVLLVVGIVAIVLVSIVLLWVRKGAA